MISFFIRKVHRLWRILYKSSPLMSYAPRWWLFLYNCSSLMTLLVAMFIIEHINVYIFFYKKKFIVDDFIKKSIVIDDFYERKVERWWLFYTKIPSLISVLENSSMLINVLFQKFIVQDFSIGGVHRWWIFYTKSWSLITFSIRKVYRWYLFLQKNPLFMTFLIKTFIVDEFPYRNVNHWWLFV